MRARFEVLVVCTANVSRSPMAAALLRHHLQRRFGEQAATIRVTSAGTAAEPGRPTDPDVAAVLTTLQRPAPAPGAARALDAQLLAAADLVLTMTRDQRGHVITLVPPAQRRVFTVVELARICRHLGREGRLPAAATPAAGLRALLATAPAWRGPTAPRDPASDDVDDVHGAKLEVQVKAARRLDEAIAAVVEVL
ncbi:arsenate reductase/protein-tyrosine-phosphatase family protein [Kineococcus sp. SYSU DK001]|uniref:arsenate reductase/protein-tyrosine-phosphatase family protein n=1 Tax=Kineococcus sp. SYSU DK001 TaxID=3383122 RepID=UPI003D7C6823